MKLLTTALIAGLLAFVSIAAAADAMMIPDLMVISSRMCSRPVGV